MINERFLNQQPVEIQDDIFLLGGYNFFNLYMVRGENKCALIELGVSAIVDRVAEQIKSIRIEPDFLILTHPHSDHLTGWNNLHERYPKAQLITARNASEFVTRSENIKIMTHEDKFMHVRLKEMGFVVTGQPITSLMGFDNRMIIDKVTCIDLGSISIKCIPVKGHSIGNLIVEVPERKAVMVSDSLGYQFHDKHVSPFLTSYSDYVSTIDSIIDLKPKMVGPAHHGPFLGAEALKVAYHAKEAATSFYDMIFSSKEPNEILIKKVFKKTYVGILEIITKKSIMYCSEQLVHNVKS